MLIEGNPSTINKINNKLINKKFSLKKTQTQTHSFSFRNNLIFTYYLNIFQRLTITIRMEKWICLKHKSIYITKTIWLPTLNVFMSFKISLTFSLSSFCVYYALKHLIKRKSNLQNYNAPNYINWYVTHIKVYLNIIVELTKNRICETLSHFTL